MIITIIVIVNYYCNGKFNVDQIVLDIKNLFLMMSYHVHDNFVCANDIDIKFYIVPKAIMSIQKELIIKEILLYFFNHYFC